MDLSGAGTDPQRGNIIAHARVHGTVLIRIYVMNAQIPTSTATGVHQANFIPAPGCQSPHLQTLLPRIIPQPKLKTVLEWLETLDHDWVELNWYGLPVPYKPILVLFHGLEGNQQSPYITSMMQAARQRGISCVIMHFRGCGQYDNTQAQSYHSGATDDARHCLHMLSARYPTSPLWACGYSLGANMLLKLAGEGPHPLARLAAVCPPFELGPCADRLNQGLSKGYQHYLLSPLKQKTLRKHRQGLLPDTITPSTIKQSHHFRAFDGQITGPLHGFKDANDYYHRASCRAFLPGIQSPTLILFAEDDPFMDPACVPSAEELSATTRLELSRHGGHVGFIHYAGGLRHWLPERLLSFLTAP